ncbi:MAG TPA: GxxExxY protein [Nitrospirae bacterium]|nr:hypothetical protein BMS3Abin10_02245 [bacterium BMS3Abin10]GBE38497.1 hypothetical protein BMS3Bbin08_01104 [bacterium BMS3Bbin08]HDH51170.1 GxxExxY protein [Nitrospirota bacterium]HDK17727.1 GxxExxY protein [Nitrospirota bacterium]HDK82321.1 GxxExxY protein [Nitrospirota bacterium]
MITEKNTDKNKNYIYEDLTYKIIGAIYNVHQELGNVHKESIYHKALAIELSEIGTPCLTEVK